MKKLIVALCLMFAMLCCTALAEEAAPALTEEEVRAKVIAAYEAEKAKAIANAPYRLVEGDPMMMERATMTGYVGGKEDNYFSLDYTINDCMIHVGESVVFELEGTSRYAPVLVMLGGVVLDEDFGEIGQIEPEIYTSSSRAFRDSWNYTGKRAGYVMFLCVVSDMYDHVMSLSTCTVQISNVWEDPLFDNLAVDGNMAVRLYLDTDKISVGETVTAYCTVTRDVGPVRYAASWSLFDSDRNDLEEETFNDTYYGPSGSTLSFPFTPSQAGECMFMIVIGDGEGAKLTINSTGVDVENSSELFQVSVSTNKTSLNAGESATATYSITGHTCSSMEIFRGVRYFEDGEVIGADGEYTSERSGTYTISPRLGKKASAYVEVTCDHTDLYYYNEAYVTLRNGLHFTLDASADLAVSGQPISVTYSVTGGLKPYQDIIVRGYTYGEYVAYTTFMQRPGVPSSGTLSGTPYIGEWLYFEVEVIEADGVSTFYWISDIPVIGAPEVMSPELTVSLNKQSFVVGETVEITYNMSGGSGTIFNGVDGATGSYAIMYTDDGSYAFEETITDVSGQVKLQPTVPGLYWIYVTVKDGYGQEVFWESEAVIVEAAPEVERIPGDANEDGYADLFDALLVLQYDAGWSVSINESNADVNADGFADLFDALLILQYDAGWDVTLW